MTFATKLCTVSHLTLGMLLPYLRKLKVRICSSCERKCEHGTFLNVPILIPQRVHASVRHLYELHSASDVCNDDFRRHEVIAKVNI